MAGTHGSLIGAKDRQSRMAGSWGHADAPIKKGGAGGNYTWGSPMDVQDFVPVGVTEQKVQVMAAQPVVYMQPQTMAVSISDNSQFPTLGAAPVTTMPRSWGPVGGYLGAQPNVAAPQLVQTVAPIRQAVDFGPTRPRNTFAKRPVQTSSLQLTQPVAIDWSQAGTAAISQAIQAMPNTAHTSPYVTAPTPVPLNVLRAQPTVAQTVQYQQPTKAVSYQQQPGNQRPMILQSRGR